jgi:flagellar biosynthesis GTPase FlhF
MKNITYLLALSLTLISLSVSAAPRRRVIANDHSSAQRNDRSPPHKRRRVIQAQPASQQASQSRAQRRQDRQAQRRQDRQVQHRQDRQAQRRQDRQIQRRQSRRVERRQQRRLERRQHAAHRSVSRHHARHSRHNRGFQPSQRRHRRMPSWVFAPPVRVVVDHRHPPRSNDDAFFDRIYHDGARYGINNDFRDEERRIQRGIRRGLITPSEAHHLNALLMDAYDLEDACIADGYLSEEEEADLYWAERDLNRAIRWEMRDFDTW